MAIETFAAKRARAHTRYYSRSGALLPGVTTVIGVLAKPALVPWANKLGLQGINVGNYVDTLAQVGTIGHDLICCHNKGTPFQVDGRPAELIDKAENCFLSYLAWEKGHTIEPLLCEQALISEGWGYGGTVDMYAKVDGVPTIVDYKTGKAIYPEHIYQVAAYRTLLEENGFEVKAVRILQIGRDETEGFSEKTVADTAKEWEIFTHCLAIYRLMKTK